MKTYKVTIDFGTRPSFATKLRAESEEAAKKEALAYARCMGWDAPVKKYVAVEVAEVAA